MAIARLETARLYLRPLCIEDAEQMQIWFPRWEIVRHLADVVPWPYPVDGALTYCRDHALPAMEAGTAWHWTLRPKTQPVQLIGCISLFKSADNNRGFWLGVPWQGQGLMTEAVRTVTDYWFDRLKFPVLRAPKAVANLASRRISIKTGMRIVGLEERSYVCGRLPSEIWEITAEEWHAAQASGSPAVRSRPLPIESARRED